MLWKASHNILFDILLIILAHTIGLHTARAAVCQEICSTPLLNLWNNMRMKNSNQLWKQAESLTQFSHISCSEIQTYATRIENRADDTLHNNKISRQRKRTSFLFSDASCKALLTGGVGWSVFHLGSHWNSSTTVRWMVMTFGTDVPL